MLWDTETDFWSRLPVFFDLRRLNSKCFYHLEAMQLVFFWQQFVRPIRHLWLSACGGVWPKTKLRITQRRIFLEGTVVVGVGPWRTALLNFCSTKQVNLSNEHWFLWICTLCCSVLSFDSNITCLSHLSIAPLSWGLWKKIQLLVFFIFCSHFESINQRSL